MLSYLGLVHVDFACIYIQLVDVAGKLPRFYNYCTPFVSIRIRLVKIFSVNGAYDILVQIV